jgi:hypothetical protein
MGNIDNRVDVVYTAVLALVPEFKKLYAKEIGGTGVKAILGWMDFVTQSVILLVYAVERVSEYLFDQTGEALSANDKKELVVKLLDKFIPLKEPFESFDGPVFNAIISLIISKFNFDFDKSWIKVDAVMDNFKVVYGEKITKWSEAIHNVLEGLQV